MPEMPELPSPDSVRLNAAPAASPPPATPATEPGLVPGAAMASPPPPALPGWARGAPATSEDGWWRLARRWWQGRGPGRGATVPCPPEAAAPAAAGREPAGESGREGGSGREPGAWPAAPPALSSAPVPLDDAVAGPPAPAAPLLERLRRSVAHALRHPGYGFALLVLVLQPPAGTPVRTSLRRQVEHRLQLLLRPGDALEALHGPAGGAGSSARDGTPPQAPPPLAAEGPATAAEGPTCPFRMALVLDGLVSADDLVAVVERVRREMAEPFLQGHTPLRLRMALVAVHAQPGAPPQPAESLLARAETLLAGLGAEGVAGLDSRSPAKARTAAVATAAPRLGLAELERALDAGELHLEYQPVLALDTGAVLALDLAWRWQHRQQGLLRADAVMQALLTAERGSEAGLADCLTDRLAREALRTAAADCAPLAQTHGAAAPSRLALVLTPAQLARADTVDRLAESLAQAGLQPAQLQLILPALPDPADRNPHERLRALVAQGYTLSLEGVGDSRRSPTLATLAAAPLALWRLAPGLLAGPAAGGEHRQVLLDGILSYARDLGVATLATGLDTPEALAQARRRACPLGQGSALAAPMPAPALPRWLARQIAQPA